MINTYKEVYDANINHLNRVMSLLELKFKIKCGIVYDSGLNLFYIEFVTETKISDLNEWSDLTRQFDEYLNSLEPDDLYGSLFEEEVSLNFWFRYNSKCEFKKELDLSDRVKFLLNNDLYDESINELICSFMSDNLNDIITSFNNKQKNMKYVLPNPFINLLVDVLKYLDNDKTKQLLKLLSTFVK